MVQLCGKSVPNYGLISAAASPNTADLDCLVFHRAVYAAHGCASIIGDFFESLQPNSRQSKALNQTSACGCCLSRLDLGHTASVWYSLENRKTLAH
jgi:hypothetical protein